MSNEKHPPASLDDYGAENWQLPHELTAPAAIVNPDASLYRCIAWCWSEVDSIHQLALALTEVRADDSPSLFGAVVSTFAKRTQALESMLNHLMTSFTPEQARAVAAELIARADAHASGIVVKGGAI